MDEETAKRIVKGWIEGLAEQAASMATGVEDAQAALLLAHELKLLADHILL